MDRALAASGLVVVAIDFRLAPAHPHPAALLDLNYAIRWLKAHAAELGASPARLGAFGSSSGGHQAVLSALRPRDRRYAALPLAEAPEQDASLAYVVAGWPVLDPHARYLYAREAGRAELVRNSEAYWGDEAAMQEGSPTLILERGEPVDLPPVLVVYGTADANVPRAIVDRFVAAYRARGGAAGLALFPGAPHGFGNLVTELPDGRADGASDAARAIEQIKQFVAGQLA